MNKRDIAAHKVVASLMSYSELVDIIHTLQKEKIELGPQISSQHKQDYDILIEIYSIEMKLLVSMLNKQHHHSKIH